MDDLWFLMYYLRQWNVPKTLCGMREKRKDRIIMSLGEPSEDLFRIDPPSVEL